MVRSFHGGIKKQKRIFGGAPAEGRLILEKDEAFVYFIPCEESACVELGERVFVGSVLACAEGSCPVLSGVSGFVSGIDENRITVISDGSDEALPALPAFSGSLSETAPVFRMPALPLHIRRSELPLFATRRGLYRKKRGYVS